MMDGLDGMHDAPRDREIEVWNGFYGWYRTKFEDGEWPKRGEPGWPDGVWYPVPSKWREIDAALTPSPASR